jgi:PAS domain S-box-containing protein
VEGRGDAPTVDPSGFDALFGRLADGVTVQSAQGALVYANPAAAQMLGYATPADLLAVPPAELVARWDLFDEEGNEYPPARLPGRAALRCELEAEQTIRWRDRATGTERWSVVRATPVLDPDGHVLYAVNFFTDVTERRRSAESLAFLAEASRVLATSLDLETVTRLAVPTLGDWCVVHLLDEDGTLRRRAAAHVDPAKERLALGLANRYPIRVGDPGGPGEVVATGCPLFAPEIPEDLLQTVTRDEEHERAVRSLEVSGYLCVPLVARGRTIGSLSATLEGGRRRYEPADLAVAEELARRAAVAVDNARLYGEVQDALRRQEESYALLDTVFASAPIGLAFLDPELRYLRVNEALARTNDRPAEDVVGRRLTEVFPKTPAEIVAAYRSVVDTGEPIVDKEIATSTGRHFVASYYPVRAAGGETLGVGAVVNEVTDRRRMEDVLRESEERFRMLADTAPVMIWIADADGRATYVNRGWLDFTGRTLEDELGDRWREGIHPDDAAACLAVYDAAFDAQREFEMEYRLRRRDGVYRWVVDRGLPRLTETGEFAGYIGSAIDITERKEAEDERMGLLAAEEAARISAESAQRRFAFLAEASALLASSLEVRSTLDALARLAVPSFADWCVIDLARADGELERVAVVHVDEAKVALAEELRHRYPADPATGGGAYAVLASGEPRLVHEIGEDELASFARDDEHLRILRGLGLRSYMSVPLIAHGRTLGAISFVSAESGRLFGPDDLPLAEELARRAAVAVDNARLYDEAERRAQAAIVLETVADGVVMVDRDGLIRLWNPAAEAITGLAAERVLGRPAEETVPGWPAEPGRPATLPLDVGDREVWLSVSGVSFAGGTVYAFRDLTEERRLEELKTEFVATASHELRTPLAAVYGAAMTLQREDLDFVAPDVRRRLLAVIADQSDRLARIVNDILWASRIDSGRLSVEIDSCDAFELARSVVEAARAHLPAELELALVAPPDLPQPACDAEKLRQVLTNLVGNAIKYSPDGGRVEMRLESDGGRMRFAVQDEGLGIPAGEQRRIFEKFYRLDPNQTRGVGGTGLGLYICRELVDRMGGRISVASREGEGSTFFVDLPLADAAAVSSPGRRGGGAPASEGASTPPAGALRRTDGTPRA